jgi:cytochrome c oxidase assembly factor CtaG
MTGRPGCQTVTLTRAVPLAHSSGSWELPPAVLIGAALALVLFTQAFVRLRRRRPDHTPWSRALLFAAGLALLVLPLVSPVDHLGDDELLSAHMLQHVLIGDAAPALLLVAVRGPLLFFLLPPFLLRPLASFRPLRAFLSVLLIPLVSLGLWAVTMYAWHIPAIYDYAAAQPLVDALLFTTSAAYPRYTGAHGISALTDQRLAGVVMVTEQLLTLGICVALLLRPYVRERQRKPAFT